ncbi:ornithine carbamoyltransferase [bacterium]|nr:ornithine carbamoyltransferase [bacterium]MBU4134009.1 ornithine carbamoyltransferase [bacterium]
MKTNGFLGRDWIDAELDYTREEWETLIDVGLELKRMHAMNQDQTYILKGKTLYTMFFNQSLRTRSTFAAGIQQLGGFHVDLEPGKTYTPARRGFEVPYKTERICDVAQNLSRTGDAIAIRMYGEPAQWIYGFANASIKEFAHYSDVPVINMECDKFHPTQSLADMITVKEKFGGFKKRKFVMSWAYSGSTHKPYAVPQSLVLAPAKMGMDVVFARPKGFELDPEVIKKCKEFATATGGSFEETDSMEDAFKDADVVYPKCWGAGDYFAKADANGKKIKDEDLDGMKVLFDKNTHWICDAKKMKLIKPSGIYMHCLPADRDMEVTDEVIDGPQSVVFDEAENRLHAHKAIMAMLMGGRL